jgi:uncharacterized protein YifN (PemK superfamily)
MPILFNPAPGTILICDYRGFIPPEMEKVRPVLVISPAFKHRYKLSTVVALSTTPPNPVMPYHYEFALNPPLPAPFDSAQMWVKGDMVLAASHDRLDRFRMGKNALGKRVYGVRSINAAVLLEVQKAVLHGLGLGQLIPYIDT